MNIDRHNYEMYFLLYVDNELSAAERNAVEKFVAENVDLATELEQLKQTALPGEEILFTARQSLYKSEISPDFLQEQMLLHLDGELESLSTASLSAEIAANDELLGAWNILKQTKLDPNERIVFENKKSLYRYENDNVVTMRFWRAAAAVLLIGATLFIGITKFSKNKKPEEVATSGNGQQPSKKLNPAADTNIPDKQPAKNLASAQLIIDKKATTENNIQPLIDNATSAIPIKNKNGIPVKSRVNIQTGKGQQQETVKTTANKKETNNLPKPYFENINNNIRNKTALSTVQDNINALQNKNEDLKQAENAIAASSVKDPKVDEEAVLTEMNTSYAKHAVMSEIASDEGNNSVFLINEEKVARSKIGGLFRKVSRVLTRNANIKTGNSVRIAGFEIATK